MTPAPTLRAPAAGIHATHIVRDYFAASIAALEASVTPLAAALATAQRVGKLTAARADEIVAPFAAELLARTDVPVFGAGFIAAIDLLSDAHSHLAWWQGAERRQLVLAAQTVSKERIDYSDLEWFRVPQQSGHTHVAGPYVDYLCSDEYTMTLATPVHVEGAFAGVAAFDLLIDEVERRLLPRFSGLGVNVTLVNGVNRVIGSTNPHHATGDAIRPGDLPEASRIPCDTIAMDVIVSPI